MTRIKARRGREGRGEKYPEPRTTEIRPPELTAHARLKLEQGHPKSDHEHMAADGIARERSMPDGLSYRKWSGQVVRHELQLAGWRLADLLQQPLAGRPEATPPAAPQGRRPPAR